MPIDARCETSFEPGTSSLSRAPREFSLHRMPRDGQGRRRIRLEREAYRVLGAICSVTIVVKGRAPVFGDPQVAAAAVDVLRARALRDDVPVYGYCVMPDHVHIVLGPSASCDVVTFVGRFKNLVLRAAWRLGVTGVFWQPSFWDRFLRSDEQLPRVVDYVLRNPVRSGAVERWQDYPFSGSLVFDLSTDWELNEADEL